MWELDHKESWTLKNYCFWTVVLEKTLESPLDSKKIKLVNPKRNQPWIFIGRIDAETPIFWPSDAKNWLTGKKTNTGKDWGQREKGTKKIRRHHWHEFEQTLGDSEGQGSLTYCSPWGRKESDMTERLNNNEVHALKILYPAACITDHHA